MRQRAIGSCVVVGTKEMDMGWMGVQWHALAESGSVRGLSVQFGDPMKLIFGLQMDQVLVAGMFDQGDGRVPEAMAMGTGFGEPEVLGSHAP